MYNALRCTIVHFHIVDMFQNTQRLQKRKRNALLASERKENDSSSSSSQEKESDEEDKRGRTRKPRSRKSTNRKQKKSPSASSSSSSQSPVSVSPSPMPEELHHAQRLHNTIRMAVLSSRVYPDKPGPCKRNPTLAAVIASWAKHNMARRHLKMSVLVNESDDAVREALKEQKRNHSTSRGKEEETDAEKAKETSDRKIELSYDLSEWNFEKGTIERIPLPLLYLMLTGHSNLVHVYDPDEKIATVAEVTKITDKRRKTAKKMSSTQARVHVAQVVNEKKGAKTHKVIVPVPIVRRRAPSTQIDCISGSLLDEYTMERNKLDPGLLPDINPVKPIRKRPERKLQRKQCRQPITDKDVLEAINNIASAMEI